MMKTYLLSMHFLFYFPIVVVVDISSSSTPTPSPKKAAASVDSDDWSSFEEAENLAKANAKKKLFLSYCGLINAC